MSQHEHWLDTYSCQSINDLPSHKWLSCGGSEISHQLDVVQTHDGVERGRALRLAQRSNQIVSFWLGQCIPSLRVCLLSLDTVDLGETRKGLLEMERCVAHQHVRKANELIKVIATVSTAKPKYILSRLDEGLSMQRITPHGLDDSADVASEIELVPELGMPSSHFHIYRQSSLARSTCL